MLFKPDFPVRAKVRIGEKRKSQSGKEFPTSVDYFVSDDPELTQLFGDKPQAIRVRFPFQSADDNFSSGLEWWVRSKKGNNVLACYTKDGGQALRMSEMVNPDDTVLGDPIKSGRIPVKCRFRDCPIFAKKDANRCRPMARLQFFLDGGRTDAVLELDTKSWNSIEALTAAFSTMGDPRGRVFELSVSFRQKGRDRFPVLALTEADVQINTQDDVTKADAFLMLNQAVETGDLVEVRAALAATLDQTNPGWKQKPAFVERIKEVGVLEAAKGLLARYEA